MRARFLDDRWSAPIASRGTRKNQLPTQRLPAVKVGQRLSTRLVHSPKQLSSLALPSSRAWCAHYRSRPPAWASSGRTNVVVFVVVVVDGRARTESHEYADISMHAPWTRERDGWTERREREIDGQARHEASSLPPSPPSCVTFHASEAVDASALPTQTSKVGRVRRSYFRGAAANRSITSEDYFVLIGPFDATPSFE